MKSLKQQDLIKAVVHYILSCVEDGDLELVKELGLSERDAGNLLGLKLSAVQRLYEAGNRIFDININVDTYRKLLSHLLQEQENQNLYMELIKADAPLSMLQKYYAITGRQYAMERKLLNIPPSVGAVPRLNEEVENEVWTLWQKSVSEKDESMGPLDYLEISRKSKAPLRAVWRYTQEWHSQKECVSG